MAVSRIARSAPYESPRLISVHWGSFRCAQYGAMLRIQCGGVAQADCKTSIRWPPIEIVSANQRQTLRIKMKQAPQPHS